MELVSGWVWAPVVLWWLARMAAVGSCPWFSVVMWWCVSPGGLPESPLPLLSWGGACKSVPVDASAVGAGAGGGSASSVSVVV